MADTKVEVKINKNVVDEWARKRIDELESDLSKALNREKRAKARVKEYEAQLERANMIVTLAEEFTWRLDEITDAIPKDYA